jgi:hypothetical protein
MDSFFLSFILSNTDLSLAGFSFLVGAGPVAPVGPLTSDPSLALPGMK